MSRWRCLAPPLVRATTGLRRDGRGIKAGRSIARAGLNRQTTMMEGLTNDTARGIIQTQERTKGNEDENPQPNHRNQQQAP